MPRQPRLNKRLHVRLDYPAALAAEHEARIQAHAARVARECPYAERMELFDPRVLEVAGVLVRVYPGRGQWWWRIPSETGDRHHGPFASKAEALADCERSVNSDQA